MPSTGPTPYNILGRLLRLAEQHDGLTPELATALLQGLGEPEPPRRHVTYREVHGLTVPDCGGPRRATTKALQGLTPDALTQAIAERRAARQQPMRLRNGQRVPAGPIARRATRLLSTLSGDGWLQHSAEASYELEDLDAPRGVRRRLAEGQRLRARDRAILRLEQGPATRLELLGVLAGGDSGPLLGEAGVSGHLKRTLAALVEEGTARRPRHLTEEARLLLARWPERRHHLVVLDGGRAAA